MVLLKTPVDHVMLQLLATTETEKLKKQKKKVLNCWKVEENQPRVKLLFAFYPIIINSSRAVRFPIESTKRIRECYFCSDENLEWEGRRLK